MQQTLEKRRPMTDHERDQRLYNQGYAAYWKGGKNPHTAGFLDHEAWQKGFDEAKAYDENYRAEGERREQARKDKQRRNKANRLERAAAHRARGRK